MATFERALPIDGVVVVEPEVLRDDRGSFAETYRREWFPDVGEMVQANRAERVAGTVVGLHYHHRQADCWSVASGRALVVLHDLRVGSPTEAVTMTLELGVDGRPGSDLRCVLIPPGVAHGFAARTDLVVSYLVDRTYDPTDELGIAWDDPDVAADWGIAEPILSARDRANPKRADLAAADLAVFRGTSRP